MRTTKSGKSVYLNVAIFYNDDGSIHMTAHDMPGFHVAINENPKRVNGHPTLFKRLAQCLREAGAPAPKADVVNT